jgi:hypothetical protein
MQTREANVKQTTHAPAEQIKQAQELSNKRGEIVHPDVLVSKTCPDSIELRRGQEAILKSRETGKNQS